MDRTLKQTWIIIIINIFNWRWWKWRVGGQGSRETVGLMNFTAEMSGNKIWDNFLSSTLLCNLLVLTPVFIEFGTILLRLAMTSKKKNAFVEKYDSDLQAGLSSFIANFNCFVRYEVNDEIYCCTDSPLYLMMSVP